MHIKPYMIVYTTGKVSAIAEGSLPYSSFAIIRKLVRLQHKINLFHALSKLNRIA